MMLKNNIFRTRGSIKRHNWQLWDETDRDYSPAYLIHLLRDFPNSEFAAACFSATGQLLVSRWQLTDLVDVVKVLSQVDRTRGGPRKDTAGRLSYPFLDFPFGTPIESVTYWLEQTFGENAEGQARQHYIPWKHDSEQDARNWTLRMTNKPRMLYAGRASLRELRILLSTYNFTPTTLPDGMSIVTWKGAADLIQQPVHFTVSWEELHGWLTAVRGLDG